MTEVTPKAVTMKEMCETIERADFLRKRDGTSPSAQAVLAAKESGNG